MSVFPELFIAIINYNLAPDTEVCVRSLLAAGADLNQISVVDNNSSDNSVDYLRKVFSSQLLIIEADKNRGYPSGLNLGIKEALRRNSSWVLLMNNDTEVDVKFLVETKKAAHEHPTFSILCPLILYFSDPQRIWYFVGKRFPLTILYWHPYRFKRIDEVALPDFLQGDFAHGCALFVKCEVFNQIGLFDDTSLIYGDDADFSLRARSAGFKIGASSSVRMWHKISTTMNKVKPKTRYLRIRNQIRFYRRHGNLLQRVFLFVFTLVRIVALMAGDLFSAQTDLFQPTLRGWLDGWFAKITRDIE